MANNGSSLCWKCRRSCVDKCCWAEELKPVPGWEAVRQDLRTYPGGPTMESYMVLRCPEFDSRPLSNQADDMDDEGIKLMMVKAIELAREDYINDEKERRSIERWLRRILSEPEDAILNLKAAAAKADEEKRKRSEEIENAI